MNATLKWSLLLPVTAAVFCGIRIKRAFVTPKSPEQLRAEEKAHQAQVRRRLRGLPEKHDHGAARKV
jgi:hypothetical protein